jgi:hypothetical protein
MFAEASLQGTIVQRVWRYDDAVRFYLSTRRLGPQSARVLLVNEAGHETHRGTVSQKLIEVFRFAKKLK